jgi:hypothetical protein
MSQKRNEWISGRIVYQTALRKLILMSSLERMIKHQNLSDSKCYINMKIGLNSP